MTLRRVLARVGVAICICAVAGVSIMWASGWRIFVVRTGSMSPHIPPGDLVVDRPAHSARVGDVITFTRGPGQFVTHRVAALTTSGIRTKGDANHTPDYGYVTPSEIAGHVVAVIPDGGYVVEFLSEPTGVPGLVLFALALWLAWGLFFTSEPRPAPETRG